MSALCTDCDIVGKERKIGAGYTLEKCKDACRKDATCLGIDFGKKKRSGECYFNYDQSKSFQENHSFDAWSKTLECCM